MWVALAWGLLVRGRAHQRTQGWWGRAMIRMIKDERGAMWRVWHVVPQSDILKSTAPDLINGWLCFERDGEKRRLVGPPGDWLTLADTELLRLLGTAVAVKAVRR